MVTTLIQFLCMALWIASVRGIATLSTARRLSPANGYGSSFIALCGTNLDDEDEFNDEDDDDNDEDVNGKEKDTSKSLSYGLPWLPDDDDDDDQEDELDEWDDEKRVFDNEDNEDDEEEDEDNNSLSLQDQVDALRRRLVQQDQVLQILLEQLDSQTIAVNGAQQPTKSTKKPNRSRNDPFGTVVASQMPVSAVVPLKAMLFIDGTWLYYSIYTREEDRCPIRQKYGKGWFSRYDFDWLNLPKVICQALYDPGWSSWKDKKRPLEIVRACVFTSCKADTSTSSLRYQMLKELRECNYDVSMLTTAGKSEKCVDIQLAVEMLHYATVPDSFDVAILLTGDKDFLPCMARTRQKGRRVALVSMREGCNRALKVTNGIKDYNIVWLEDHLDKLLVRRPNVSGFSALTVEIVLKDFIDASGVGRVNSRDAGRHLKALKIGKRDLLNELKYHFGGLNNFIAGSTVLDNVGRGEELSRTDLQDFASWIVLMPEAERIIEESLKTATFSTDEKAFFEHYSIDNLEDYDTAFFHTRSDMGQRPEHRPNTQSYMDPRPEHRPVAESSSVTQPIVKDFSAYTVADLKERCRERNLPTSGLKSELLQRVIQDAEQEKLSPRIHTLQPLRPPRPVDPKVKNHIENIIREYLLARGGTASSRDIGRYLAAYKAYDPKHSSANVELKASFLSLSNFVVDCPEIFVKEDLEDTIMTFMVSLRNPDQKPNHGT